MSDEAFLVGYDIYLTWGSLRFNNLHLSLCLTLFLIPVYRVNACLLWENREFVANVNDKNYLPLTNVKYIFIYVYITDLVCYTCFHRFFNPKCQHIFRKQTGYIFQSPKTIKTWATKHYASLNQWRQWNNTE